MELTRVLVIDDDEDDYVMLKDLLSQVPDRKFKIDWASSYAEGKEILVPASSSKEHDVCFLDFRLGPETGLTLLKEAVAVGCKTPIILLTGYGEHEVDLEAMKSGAADYLVKDSITPALLERTIRYASHRNEVLEDIRAREENFRNLFNATFGGIFVLDDDGVILDANQPAAQVFGTSLVELIGKPLSNFCEYVPGGPTEAKGTRKDGTRIDLEVLEKSFAYRGKSARLVGVRDITGKKQMEAQILMQDRLASIGLLASSLAHEIGNPIGVIRGRAEYNSMHPDDVGHVKKNSDVIMSQIDRVSKLIRSLLNLARGDQLQGAAEVDLKQTLEDVLELMAHEFTRRAIEVQNRIESSVSIAIRAQAQPLQQVLLNLLVNAMHAIETAVKSGRTSGHVVEVSVRDLGEKWGLSVRDTGCGISEKNMRNLFKPFFTTKDIGVGTGLGLATSFRIVESWGGEIRVESKEGAGSTFLIVLPKSQGGRARP